MTHRCRQSVVRIMGALLLGVLSPAFQNARLSAAASDPKPAASEYLVEVWDTDRGLPSSAVTSIAATPDGYLWIGTFEGLARFDGIRFTVINHRNTPDFPDDAVTALHVDGSGRLWAGTGNGIVRLEAGHWRSYPGPEGGPLPFAGHITEEETGAILAVSGNRFYRLSADRFAALPAPPRIQYLKLFAVPGQGLWASAGNYFGRYRNAKWEEIELPPDLKASTGAAPGHTHGVWVAGLTGIRKYQNGAWSPILAAPPGFRFTPPVSLLEDSLGNVWAGDYRAGLIQFRKDGGVLQFTRREGLPNPTIRALFEGPEQSVWAATDGGGLVRFRRRSVTVFDEAEGLSHSVVDSVFEEAPGSLLVGTYGGGLQRFDESALRFSPPLAPLGANLAPPTLVLSVLRDSHGTIWAGTFARGLFRIRGPRAEQIAETTAGASHVVALFQDSRQTLWVGHQNGVASYSDDRLTLYPNAPGAPQKEIVSFAEDSRGDLWLGGAEGLFRLHGGRFEKFAPPGIPDYAPISSLYADRQGSLWIGVRDRGLDRLSDGKFIAYGPEQGLAASRVSSILEDNGGRLWLATQQQGLVGVTRASLDAVADGGQPQLTLVWLTRDAGLLTNQMRAGFQPAAWKASDGRLWFATLRGLALVDPRQVGRSSLHAPVRIEEVTIGSHRIPINQIAGDTLNVPPGTRHLRIAFTKPSFWGPERIRFQYGLEGLHTNWVDAAERSASFGDLQPGHYIFRVRATNSDGIWNAGTAELKIVVQPFYWETLWFRLAVVLALTAITGAAGYSIQSRKLKRRTRQLEKEQALRRDIERMQAVLRISEERFAKAFDSCPIPMSIVALDDGRYLYVNQRFLESSGYRSEELIGRRRADVDVWVDPQEAARFTELTKANRRVRNFEARVKTPDGRLGYHLLSTEVIELNGQRCLLVAADDVTERKRLEEQLQQAQKLESIGRLAGGVAHDFNNLLTVINGYSDLVLHRLQPGDPNWSRVDQIRKAGDRAAELTRQLLAFSRKQVIAPQTLDVNFLIRETEPMLRRLLPETIEISLQLVAEPLHVTADPGQLNQVLINLAVNARDAMPEGGTLMVESDTVELDEEFAGPHPGLVPGPYVRLAISDSGVGMSADVRNHVFEPFFTTKGKGAGTGLGLATVYGIVRQSGGWIWVYSEPGHGTVFKIYLPRVAAGIAGHAAQASPARSYRGRETVLVVEDQEDVRNLAREVLESYGYLVLVAAHGADALLLAENYRGPIHLMLTDVVMPGMTGKELAVRMKSQRPATKVLYMSGYTENVIATQGVIDSGIAFIPKPLAPEALAAKVRETLGPPEIT
jgi:two-component system cell cycle sensor histidine kinase/response regulator CckA